MVEECSCPVAGLCDRRGKKITPAHWKLCQNGHIETVDRFYSRNPAPQVVDRNMRRNAVPARASKGLGRVGAALTKRITKLIGSAAYTGCNCRKMADQMDRGGFKWVEQNREVIIDQMVNGKSREAVITAVLGKGLLNSVVSVVTSGVVGDAAMRAGAEWLLDAAIEDARKELREAPAPRVRRARKGIDSPFNPEWNVSPGTWVSTTRHLTYHVWPTIHHETWKWNLEQIASRSNLFNGKRVLGVVTDQRSHGAGAVIKFSEQLGLNWTDIVERRNEKRLREVVTWLPMLEILNPSSAGPEEVVFSAHAKGVRHNTSGDHLQQWAELMYRSCLDDWPSVESQLSHFLATGSFKRYGMFNTQDNKRWHYSGTFFWWRLAEIGRRNWKRVDRQFFGTESWLGHQCYRNETGSLFLDNAGDLYKPDYWRETVDPEWQRYLEQMK